MEGGTLILVKMSAKNVYKIDYLDPLGLFILRFGAAGDKIRQGLRPTLGR